MTSYARSTAIPLHCLTERAKRDESAGRGPRADLDARQRALLAAVERKPREEQIELASRIVRSGRELVLTGADLAATSTAE